MAPPQTSCSFKVAINGSNTCPVVQPKIWGNHELLSHSDPQYSINQQVCVERPNQKTKTGQMDTKTRPLYMLLTRDPPQNKGHIQTESEGLEKDINSTL